MTKYLFALLFLFCCHPALCQQIIGDVNWEGPRMYCYVADSQELSIEFTGIVEERLPSDGSYTGEEPRYQGIIFKIVKLRKGQIPEEDRIAVYFPLRAAYTDTEEAGGRQVVMLSKSKFKVGNKLRVKMIRTKDGCYIAGGEFEVIKSEE